VPSADPRRADLAAAVDTALGRRMSSVLHDPAVQSLEAAWRGLDWLVRQLELDETLQLFVMDMDLDALRRDAAASADAGSSRFHQAVVAPAMHLPGGEPWAVWTGLYSFTQGPDDAALLAGLGRIAHEAGTPFLAGMDPGFIDLWQQPEPPTPESMEAWNALRRMPEAGSLGLALPRFLLRLPYGRQTDPMDAFPYEEMPGQPDAPSFLWGNPALVCLGLLGRSFTQSGWDLEAGLATELDELPAHYYKEDGESKMTPCAERWLNDSISEALIRQGLMPVQSIQRRNAIRFPRVQSIREPLTGLAGRWR
jgi:type VI secretion system protein ImpC